MTAPAQEGNYPTLLDEAQWTQAATFNQDDRFSGPSQRIGRYYRQQLKELDEAQLEAKRAERLAPASPLRPPVERKGWAAGLNCKPLLTPLEASHGEPSSFGRSAAGLRDSSAFALLSRQHADAEAQERSIFEGTHRQAHITDADALQARFDEYVRTGVDESSLAPFNKTWAINAMEQVPRELAGVDQSRVDSRLNQMLKEVSENYYSAVKVRGANEGRHRLWRPPRRTPAAPMRPPRRPARELGGHLPATPYLGQAAMVAYVLRNPAEAKRLEMTIPPKPFGLRAFHPSQDPSVAECAAPTAPDSLALGVWHENVLNGYETVERALLVNHDGMLQMLDLWTLYQHLQLCNTSALPPVAALELERFKDQQHAHCERVVQMLKKKWLPAVIDIFRAEAISHEAEEEDGPPPLLAAVSALMFNQLRGIFNSSVEAYVSFIEQYATGPGGAPLATDEHALNSEAVDDRPLLLVRMLVEGEGFKFSPSAATVAKSLVSILDHFVAIVNTIPRVETELGRASPGVGRHLAVAAVDEEVIARAKQRLQAVVEANMELTDSMVQAYTPFSYLLSAETDAQVAEFNSERHTLQEVAAEIAKYDSAAKAVAKRTVPEVRFNLVLAACQAVQTKLASRADDLAGRLRSHIGNGFLAKNAEMCGRYQEVFLRLGVHPTTDEAMVELEKFLGASSGLLATLTSELNEGRKALRFLLEQRYQLDEEQLRLVGETWAWPGKIRPKVEECSKRLRAERERVEDELTAKRDRFLQELDDCVAQAHTFRKLGDIDRMAENTAALSALASKVKDAKARGASLNEEEALLGFPLSQFPQLAEVPALITPYQALWSTANDFQQSSFRWLNGPMKDVDPEAVDSEVKAMWKNNFKSIKAFSEDGPDAPLKVAEQLKARIDEFQEKLPLILCLCNKGMRDRHWERVSEVLGKPFRPTDKTSLSTVLTKDLTAKVELIDEIAAAASKEYSLEKVRRT